MLQRAERFGIAPSKKSLQQIDAEKLKQRADRFGLQKSEKPQKSAPVKVGSVKANAPPVDPEKLQKRLERFGPISSTAKKQTSEQQKQAEEEKKKQRQQRFELNLSPAELEEQKERLVYCKVENFCANDLLLLRMKKRKERFGDLTKNELPESKTEVDPELAEKLAKRAKRFAKEN